MSRTGSEICKLQNSDRGKRLLAARQETFRTARQLFLIQFALMVLIPLGAWSVVTVIGFGRPIVASAILLITVLDIVLIDAIYKSRIVSASRISQEFDCFIFGIPAENLFYGNPEDPSAILQRARAFEKRDAYSEITDWYSTAIDGLPAPYAALVCQRTNLSYDKQVRGTYRAIIFIGLCAIIGLMTLCTLVIDQKLSFLISALFVPAAPLIIWSFREWKRQETSIDEAKRLQSYSESHLNGLISNQVSPALAEDEVRRLQNAIYLWRSNSPLSFPGIYRLRRAALEQNMNDAADLWAERYAEKEDDTPPVLTSK